MKLSSISDTYLMQAFTACASTLLQWRSNRRFFNTCHESLGRPGDGGITDAMLRMDTFAFRSAVAGIPYYPFEHKGIYELLVEHGVKLLHDNGDKITA